MNAPAGIGHNGGPALQQQTPTFYIGERGVPLFAYARYKALYGGRGSRKSHSIAEALVLLSKSTKTERQRLAETFGYALGVCCSEYQSDAILIVCARQFQNSIRDSVKELIEQKINYFGLAAEFTVLDREIRHNVTGSRFIFIGLDRNPQSAKSLEGADICWVEEARTINQRSMEILIPTIRKPGSELWWSWNPEQPEDPVDDYFRGNNPKRTGTFIKPTSAYIARFGIEDNPWFYHTAMPDEMYRMQQGNEARYKHVWLGEYDLDYEGKIFTDVVIGRVEVPDHIAPRYGMDFSAGGKDPHAIVKVYVNIPAKWIYVAREAGGRFSSRLLPAHIRQVVDDDSDLIKADSSQPDTIDILNAEGFNVVGARKGPGSLKAGILWLQGFKIYIDPECEQLRDEARLYTWQKDRLTGQVLRVPIDANNHYWDAVRYATEDCQTEGSSPENDPGFVKFGIGRRR